MKPSSERGFKDLLARYPRGVQPLGDLESLGGAGGLSGSRLWRYRSERGLLVLRGWPPDGPGRAHLEQVHHWLRLVDELGFIPTPIADRAGGSLQEHEGRFWELVPWMPGAAEGRGHPRRTRPVGVRRPGRIPPAPRRRAADGTIPRPGTASCSHRAAARGRVRRDGAGHPPAGRDAPDGPAMAGAGSPGRARLLDPLRTAAGRVVPLQPCVRDARPEHFLFEGDRVSGLVNFGAMGVELRGRRPIPFDGRVAR